MGNSSRLLFDEELAPTNNQTINIGQKGDDPPLRYFLALALQICGVFVLTALAITVVVMLQLLRQRWYHRRNFPLMSKEEVDLFRNGQKKKPLKIQTIGGRTETTGDEEEEEINNLSFPKEYEVERRLLVCDNVISEGNFGFVYKAQLTINNVTKTVTVETSPFGCSRESFEITLSGLKVLCYVQGKHSHVVEFIGAYIKEIGKGIVDIVTEFCENGTLLSYLINLEMESRQNVDRSDNREIENPNDNDTENFQLNRFAYEISSGMEYLGQKKIIFGDLSAKNVFLDSNLTCKIGDLGLARKLGEYHKYVAESQRPFAWQWMAVESLKMMEFTTKSDVWSYSVTLWEIYSLGAVPYPDLVWSIDFVNELENGLKLSSPAKASTQIYEMMMSCWNLDPEQRPTFSEVSAFFQSL